MCGFVDLQKVGRRQDMGTYYRLNGAIYLQTTELLMSQGDLYGEHSYACVMSQEHSIDIAPHWISRSRRQFGDILLTFFHTGRYI